MNPRRIAARALVGVGPALKAFGTSIGTNLLNGIGIGNISTGH
jgi:hypothetical protein